MAVHACVCNPYHLGSKTDNLPQVAAAPHDLEPLCVLEGSLGRSSDHLHAFQKLYSKKKNTA